MSEKPKPGSDEAVKIGCTCARMDNHYGRGYGLQPNVFVISGDCPVHGDLSPPIGLTQAEDSKNG